MRTYPQELVIAARNDRLMAEQGFPYIDKVQVSAIQAHAARLLSQSLAHQFAHNSLNASVYCVILFFDYLALMVVPKAPIPGWATVLASGLMHGYLSYSMIIFSIHETAFHAATFKGTNPMAKVLRFLGCHASRLFFGDPEYYKLRHRDHHAHFGSERDGAFTNFVLPSRILRSFLPGAAFLPFNDYRVHADSVITRSALWTYAVGFLYHGCYFLLSTRQFNFWVPLFSLAVIGPWFAFALDRLRESSEHNLMPSQPSSGARNFGLSVWGLLIGGGPWGQPCHLSHHLAPALSWYQQIRLHFHIRALLTPEQRVEFIVERIAQYPRLILQLVKRSKQLLDLSISDGGNRHLQSEAVPDSLSAVQVTGFSKVPLPPPFHLQPDPTGLDHSNH